MRIDCFSAEGQPFSEGRLLKHFYLLLLLVVVANISYLKWSHNSFQNLFEGDDTADNLLFCIFRTLKLFEIVERVSILRMPLHKFDSFCQKPENSEHSDILSPNDISFGTFSLALTETSSTAG